MEDALWSALAKDLCMQSCVKRIVAKNVLSYGVKCRRAGNVHGKHFSWNFCGSGCRVRSNSTFSVESERGHRVGIFSMQGVLRSVLSIHIHPAVIHCLVILIRAPRILVDGDAR